MNGFRLYKVQSLTSPDFLCLELIDDRVLSLSSAWEIIVSWNANDSFVICTGGEGEVMRSHVTTVPPRLKAHTHGRTHAHIASTHARTCAI